MKSNYFKNHQNLAIIGEIEFFDNGNHTNYKLKPLPESFKIGAGVTGTIKVSCACDDAQYASPDGKPHFPTNYSDDEAAKMDPTKVDVNKIVKRIQDKNFTPYDHAAI
jgi:hypothetical protein